MQYEFERKYKRYTLGSVDLQSHKEKKVKFAYIVCYAIYIYNTRTFSIKPLRANRDDKCTSWLLRNDINFSPIIHVTSLTAVCVRVYMRFSEADGAGDFHIPLTSESYRCIYLHTQTVLVKRFRKCESLFRNQTKSAREKKQRLERNKELMVVKE